VAHDEPEAPLPIRYGLISNGEYLPFPPSAVEREAARRTRELADRQARRLGIPRRRFLQSLCGAAGALFVLNACSNESSESEGESNGGQFRVPEEAMDEEEAAADAIGGDEFIFDVQTHFLEFEADQSSGLATAFPQAGCGADDPRLCFSIDTYLQELFLRSDTTMAVISAIPIVGDDSPLSIARMEEARRAAEVLCGDDRLVLHGQAFPSIGSLGAALDGMDELVAEHPIGSWKLYTHSPNGFYLDDHDPDAPQVGAAYLERVREVGPPIVSVHKGFGSGNPYASPVDIGPAAAANPDLHIVVYHSGYEPGPAEGAWSETTADVGVNRLITTLRDTGIGPGENVYAELGSTWYLVSRDPDQAAHVLGKLLVAVGPDNVVWGSDSIWYGSPQSQIEAFRAFEITEEYQEQYGYPALTPELKRKILGGNAARLYGVDPITTRCDFTPEELAEVRTEMPVRPAAYGPTTAAQVRAIAADHTFAWA
jgi:predicted TIM-barrel fold metal-dependent hydrolase